MNRILAVPMAVASVAAFHAGPAAANCGLTVTFDNDMDKEITKAVSTPKGCGAQALRAKYKVGNATKHELKSPLATLVDKKITMSFK